MRLFLLLPLLLLLPGLPGQSLYFPPIDGGAWEETAPTTLGYCPEGVRALSDFLEQSNTRAFILLKDGKIVMEEYYNNFGPDSLWLWNSAGKTVTAMLIGIAQQEGYLDLDDSASDYLGPGWTSATPEQESAISVRNLLSQTSGLDDRQGDFCTDPECLEYLADAGTRWAYHNGSYTQLTAILPAATGIPLNQYLLGRLRNRIGMNGGFLTLGYNRIYASNARSMARFGLLMLNGGVWDGTRILDDTTYHREMITSSQDLNPAYGYLWWLNGKDRLMVPQVRQVFNRPLTPSAPASTYVAMGKDGQLINVVPEENLVWIRMGDAFREGGLIAVDYNEEVWARINGLECATSTASPSREETVAIFPNPVTDVLNLNSTQEMREVTVLTAGGQRLEAYHPAARSLRLAARDLPLGMYFLRIRLSDGKEIWKRVVRTN
ncbi:serine hydrolase [Lewinella sp. W8]|uniref:serine hydrolase n=1 Tax=Lewinella sp. W8 TaxID=2528208 RepID=UPI0010685858|nr:serine hydrolase [Lewinella sp. W8]MTB53782.1 serine hydrolase [Lewinella sp. W8]